MVNIEEECQEVNIKAFDTNLDEKNIEWFIFYLDKMDLHFITIAESKYLSLIDAFLRQQMRDPRAVILCKKLI